MLAPTKVDAAYLKGGCSKAWYCLATLPTALQWHITIHWKVAACFNVECGAWPQVLSQSNVRSQTVKTCSRMPASVALLHTLLRPLSKRSLEGTES